MDYKDMKFKVWHGCDRGLCHKGCGRQNHQLNTFDWLADVPGNNQTTDLVEVQFKNTRKGYYHNVNNLDLKKGDIVAVEANPGHDIGVVTLTGRLVKLQIKKSSSVKSPDDIKRVYRLAKEVDMQKYHEAKAREHATMIESRQIAKGLGLKMKIGDVEYQGDGNKAIFYYIADERVDFRQLIKDLAAAFHVRIEMKQIGARQEAGRIGGTGPCGRELCCATWMKNFSSVSTTAARIQDISLNPTKLAGMCAKLKCCLNYEVDDYMEAGRKLPSKEVILETMDGEYHLFKTDILNGQCTYSTDKNLAATSRPSVRSVQRRLSNSTDVVRSLFRSLKMVRQNQLRSLLTSSLVLTSVDLIRLRNAKRTTNHATTTDNKVVDHNATTVVISVMDRTTTVSQMTTDVHRTITVALRMVIVVLIMVLVLHNNRAKELHRTIEMKADSLSKQKENKNET